MLTPSPAQRQFLALQGREAFYGAPAGGGNTAALVMAALHGSEHAHYKALILTREPAHLPRLKRHVGAFLPPGAFWQDNVVGFRLPSGASLNLGSLVKPCSPREFGTQLFNFIGFDRVLDFVEEQYMGMLHRANSLIGEAGPLPARVRAAGDPEGPHGAWVRRHLLAQDHVLASPADCPWLGEEDLRELSLNPTLCWQRSA